MLFLDALCVQWATRQASLAGDEWHILGGRISQNRQTSSDRLIMNESEAIVSMQHVDQQHCLEIKWRTGDLTFCEWQTHYWHVQGHCSQARDNGAVPVYWPSRQRAAHWWTTPSVFWQQVDNCLHCDGMCIFPIYGPVRHIQLLDTYQRNKQWVVHVVNLQTLLIHTGKNLTDLHFISTLLSLLQTKKRDTFNCSWNNNRIIKKKKNLFQ